MSLDNVLFLRNDPLKQIFLSSHIMVNAPKMLPEHDNTRSNSILHKNELQIFNIENECHSIINANELINHDLNNKPTEFNIVSHPDKNHNEGQTKQPEISDLQSLLIMMAISSNSEENSSLQQKHIKDVSDTSNENIQTIPTIRDDYVVSDTTFLTISPLRNKISDKHKSLLTKYVSKWKNYVIRKRDFMTNQRNEAINNFLNKLEKKKLRKDDTEQEKKTYLLARDRTYQHRYKVQRHIIALQKAKLEEQNRLIEELKYNKIVKASQQSVDAMREEVRKTYFEVDRQLKPKIKCLTNELKLNEIQEPSLILHCLKVPQFLQRMEKRAREREEKHALIRERRRQMEEERVRIKQQEELVKVTMDKEEKTNRIKELKEKRKREKIENIRKKEHAERIRALTVMADLHYEKTLKTKFGIRPLRILIDIKKENILKAKENFKFQLKKRMFYQWMWYTDDIIIERNFKSEDFLRKKLLRIGMSAFKQNHYGYFQKKQVAEDFYDLFVTQLVFRRFCEGINVLKKEQESKLQMAAAYDNSNILFKTFTCWRTLPALNALQREQEARKAKWREKVLQVVPDYTPPDE